MAQRRINPLVPLPPIKSVSVTSTDDGLDNNSNAGAAESSLYMPGDGDRSRTSKHRSLFYSRPTSATDTEADADVMKTLGSMEHSAANSLLSRIFSLTEPPLPNGPSDSSKPSHMLTIHSLRKLEKGFGTIVKNKDVDEGVDIEEFVRLWLKNVYNRQNEIELRRLFIKIDAMCTGTVTWRAFIFHTWMEMKKLESMELVGHGAPFPRQLLVKSQYREKEDIISIAQIYFIVKEQNDNTQNKTGCSAGNRYMTLSRNGLLRVFDLKCSLLDSFDLRLHHRKSLHSLITTDMVYMSNMRLLAVCFADRRVIQMYMLGIKGTVGYAISKEFEIRGLVGAPMCLEYIVNTDNTEEAYLLWGDTRGVVNILNFKHATSEGPFGHRCSSKKQIIFSLSKIQQRVYPAVSLTKVKAHRDWVVQIRRYSYMSEIGFITCCKSAPVSVYCASIHRPHEGTAISVRRGVTCFQYSQESHCIYAGCVDGKIRVIRPMIAKVTNTMVAHHKPATAIVLDERRGLVISAGEDQRIIVYNMYQFVILQTMEISNLGLANSAVSVQGLHQVRSLHLNESNSSLLIGTHYLGMFEFRETKDHTGSQYLTTHDGACNQAAYNPLFDLVVSCDTKSTICLWNLNTGEKLIQFQDCHQKKINVNLVNQEIMVFCFDPSFRRLITGANDGTVSIWNLNNGMLLRKLAPKVDVQKARNQVKGSDDVVGLIWSEEHSKILVALGSSRKVYTYLDQADNHECYEYPSIPDTDITSMIHLYPTLIATSSSSGDIVIRSLSNGRPCFIYNASVSTHSILQDRLKNFKNEFAGTPAAAVPRRKADISVLLERMLPFPTHKYRRYSSFNAPSGILKLGMNEPSDYMYDQPPYERMAFAALLGYGADSLCNSEFMEHLFSMEQTYIDLKETLLAIHREDGNKSTPSTGWQLPANHSVDCMISLLNRLNTTKTATLITGGGNGWVRAWSTTMKGELLGQFNAAHNKEESILSLATDVRNEYLFTGDSEGYLKVWDIETYCLDEEQLDDITSTVQYSSRKRRKYSHFCFLADDMKVSEYVLSRRLRLRCQLARHGIPSVESNPLQTLQSPPLLNSFRCHIRAVTSISYVDHKHLLITSSSDGNVRLWTITGLYIGQFGQLKPWNISTINFDKSSAKNLPHDVRKVASSTTLQVWNGGNFKKWNKLRAICLFTGLTSFVSHMGKSKGTNGVSSVLDLEGDSSSSESSGELNLGCTQVLWQNVAAAIHRSAVSYVRKNKVRDLQFSYDPDGDLDHIIKKLSPDPLDDELTELIKSVWLKSLKFQMLKASDEEFPAKSSSSSDTVKASKARRPTSVRIQEQDIVENKYLPYEVKMEEESFDDADHRDSQKTVISLITPEQRTRIQSALTRVSVSHGSRCKRRKGTSRASSAKNTHDKKLDLEAPGLETIFNRVITSKYFSKSYKKRGRHKRVPKIGFSHTHSSQYSIYHAIPFMEMEPLIMPTMPDYLEAKFAKVGLERPKSKSKTKRFLFGTPLPPIRHVPSPTREFSRTNVNTDTK